MRPNSSLLKTHFILPLGFGWNTAKGYSPKHISPPADTIKAEIEAGLPFEQIKMP
jgi:hypothetical protein